MAHGYPADISLNPNILGRLAWFVGALQVYDGPVGVVSPTPELHGQPGSERQCAPSPLVRVVKLAVGERRGRLDDAFNSCKPSLAERKDPRIEKCRVVDEAISSIG